VISGGHDHQIILTDISQYNGQTLYTFSDQHIGNILSIEVITTGNYFATGGYDGRLNIFKVEYNTNKPKRQKYA